jgi:hypothetical protein
MLIGALEDEQELEAVTLPAVYLLMDIAAWPMSLKFMGSLVSYAKIMLSLMKRALSRSDESGGGCRVHLLSAAARALAQISSSKEGKMALLELEAIPGLLFVLRQEVKVGSSLPQDVDVDHQYIAISAAWTLATPGLNLWDATFLSELRLVLHNVQYLHVHDLDHFKTPKPPTKLPLFSASKCTKRCPMCTKNIIYSGC